MTVSEEILLVEDDEVVAELEKRVLLGAGCEVRTAHTVKDALALLSEQSFRAIVLDYRLPDGAPWPVLEAANAHIPRTPVLLASAMESEAMVAEALERGVADFLKKEYGFWHQLPEAVNRIARDAAIDQNLQLGDELFHRIAANLSDVILVGDMRGRARYISPACLYVLGYQPEELKAALSLDLIHPDDQGLMTGLLTSIGRRGQGTLTYRCRAKNGNYRWLESNVNLLRDPASGAREVVAISRDVTERKHAEEEINKLKVNFELLLNGAKEYAVVMLDREGRVTTWNSAAERIVGYAAQEIIGCHFSTFHPAAAAALPQADEILRVAAEEGSFAEEGWRERKDGTLFWASVTITALYNADGELCGFSSATHDATEAKKTAEALALARQQADEANRAKGDFLVAMSHEIRAPLNAILGLTDVLNETELNPDQREYVARCRRAGAGLLTIINDLLDLSKIEAGRFELEKVPFDLEDLVETTAELIAPRAHLKGVALQARLAPETPTHLIGDPVRLQQILINLLGNAAKFTESGWIILSVAPDMSGPPGHLRFVVSDTGIGIPEARLESIFEDFSQAETAGVRLFGGTGLGLGIARRLVESFGGKLSVSSVFGEGSTFTFDAQFGVPELPVVPEAPPQELAGRRVLLLDDDPANRQSVAKMCCTWGMSPSVANTVPEGVALLAEAKKKQRPFSLAILNSLTPEEGGFAALAQIQTANPGLPVIMTASQTLPGDAGKARNLGAAALLLHPFRRSEMLRLALAALRPAEGPKAAATAPVLASPPLQANSAAPVKILVAEDSDDNRFLMEVYLNGLPYDLRFVENGQDAINLLEREEFDLVLMDIQMPIMDGLTATRMIRELEQRTPRTRTPILALTANALLGDAEESQAAGCDGHLAKPIAKEELITAIENVRFAACANA